MKRILSILIAIISVCGIHANIKQEADSAYATENYTLAIEKYQQLTDVSDDADVYYNLGNAYYKNGDVARAVLNYERALLLRPWDTDVKHNLKLASSKTIDKIIPQSEMFFITWFKNIISLLTVDIWSTIAIISFTITLVLLLLYLLSNKLIIRKVSFFTSIFMLVVCILTNIFAYVQYKKYTTRNEAIVMATSINVKSTPNQTGTNVFVIHAGTKVTIVDDTMNEWKEIQLSDGKIGWVETSDIEVI